MNRCVEVESSIGFDNQETLRHSHSCQQGDLPLMYASPKVLQIFLILILDKVLKMMGRDLLEGGP